MSSRPWKIVLLLVGIFIAGGVTGAFFALQVGQKTLQRRGLPEQWGPARLRVLSARLGLSPEQVERLKPVFRRDIEDLARLRQQGFAESRRILERMERDIAAVLTPEQRARFEEFNRELRQRRAPEFRRGERGDRRERPPPPERGPGG